MPKCKSPQKRIAQCRHGYKGCPVRGYHDKWHEDNEMSAFIWCARHTDHDKCHR